MLDIYYKIINDTFNLGRFNSESVYVLTHLKEKIRYNKFYITDDLGKVFLNNGKVNFIVYKDTNKHIVYGELKNIPEGTQDITNEILTLVENDTITTTLINSINLMTSYYHMGMSYDFTFSFTENESTIGLGLKERYFSKYLPMSKYIFTIPFKDLTHNSFKKLVFCKYKYVHVFYNIHDYDNFDKLNDIIITNLMARQTPQ